MTGLSVRRHDVRLLRATNSSSNPRPYVTINAANSPGTSSVCQNHTGRWAAPAASDATALIIASPFSKTGLSAPPRQAIHSGHHRRQR